MRYLVMIVLAALLAWPAPAQAKEVTWAKPLTPKEAASAVLKAVKAGDAAALAKLALVEKPDPWRVADDLCGRGSQDAAAAFAKAGSGEAMEKLADAIAAWKETPANPAARAAFDRGTAAVEKKDYKAGLAQLDKAAKSAAGMLAQRIAYQRGTALRGLNRGEESTAAYTQAAAAAGPLGWAAGAADGWAQLAFNAHRSGNAQGAFEHWKKAAGVYNKLGFRSREASMLSNLGILLMNAGQTDAAKSIMAKALGIYRDVDDPEGIARVLGNQGLLVWQQGDLEGALELFEESASLEEKIGRAKAAARTRINIASIHYHRGEYREALRMYEGGVPIFKEAGDDHSLATAYLNAGNCLRPLGQLDKSTAYTQKALDLFTKVGAAKGTAQASSNLAACYELRGDVERSVPLREAAIKVFDRLSVRAESIQQRAALGQVLAEAGRFDRSEVLLQEALKLLKGMQNPQGMSQVQSSLGVLRTRQGRFDEALTHIFKAHEIAEGMGKLGTAAGYLQNAGAVYTLRGDFARGLRVYDQAIEAFEELGDKMALATALSNVAAIRADLGQRTEAIELYKRSMAILKAAGNDHLLAHTTGNLGGAYMLDEDYARAMPLFEESRRLFKARGDPRGEATALANMATAHKKQGNTREALKGYEAALAIHKRSKDALGTAETLGSMGDLHAIAKRYTKAITLLTEARDLAAKHGLHGSLSTILANLGLAQLRSGNLTGAMKTTRAADAALRLVLGRLSDEGAARARSTWATLYRTGIRAARQAGDPVAVFEFIERGRAAALLEALGGRETLQAVVLPPELRAAEAAARAAEAGAAKRYRRAMAGKDAKAVLARRKAWRASQAAAQVVVERIQREAKAAAEVVYAEPRALSDMQASLAEDQALVLYALMGQGSSALVITKSGARHVDLESDTLIAEAAENLLAAIDPGVPDVSPEVKALRALVIDPLALPASITRLSVSPSGALSYVPLRLLIGARELSYVPSGSTALSLAALKESASGPVLAIGDPTYDTGDKAAGGLRSGWALKRLPGTRVEAKAIGGTVLLGDDATEAGFREAVSARKHWRAVHFACHGTIDRARPMLSALALTPSDEDDGFLTALDVLRTPIPANLVVLSACETGKGEVSEGEGLLGLTRAFMLAGSPRVLCSLWRVPDEASQAMMIKFYELWNPKSGSGGLSAATALAKAQTWLQGHDKWKHPYYWGAWVLWGRSDA